VCLIREPNIVKGNIQKIQTFQNKVVRGIVNALSYVRNGDIHRDLSVRMVTAEIERTAKKHEDRVHQHNNVEAIQLLDNNRTVSGSRD
jgi:hypothetical protein